MKELEEEDDLLSKVPVRSVGTCQRRLAPLITPSQESASETLQGVLRICSTTANPLSHPRCLVSERHLADNREPSRRCSTSCPPLEVFKIGAWLETAFVPEY